MGESGSGKTTLLNILAALDKPTGGTVLLGGKTLSEIPEETAAAFRRDNLGFVFQDFSLLDTFSLEDNICLPLVLAGKSRTEMRDRLSPLASDLGIAGRRADRRARLPLDRRALEALRRDQRLWPDHRDGHALCARGELRLARAVPARRRGLARVKARQGHGFPVLPAYHRCAHAAADWRRMRM